MRLDPPPQRILVKEVNWLGDLVMSLPALQAIRRTYPDAHLAVLIRRELAGFFDGLSWVNEVIPYSVPKGLGGIGERIRIVGEIRSRGFDLAVLLPTSFESALWVTAAGVPRRAGYAKDARGIMLTDKTVPPPEVMTGHQSRFWLAMVRMTAGADSEPEDSALKPAPRHLDSIRQWLNENRREKGTLIAVAPAAAYGPAKEWPIAHFATLIDVLAERYSAECVMVGAPNERPRCMEIAAASKAGALVAAGQTGIGELIALLSVVDGFAGNDSGAMHVAAALGKPTVGIFGSTNPDRTGPMGERARVIWRHLECSPCLERTCRFGHYNCLKEIHPDEVIEALETLRTFV